MSVEVHSVDTLSQANAALTTGAKYFGGGTLLMRQINYGDQSIQRLIATDDAQLKRIEIQGDQLSLGAGVTMAQIINHPDLAFLEDVARSIGGPAIRNMGTIGGNLFAPTPYGDMATALLALDATIHWADGQQQAIEQFLQSRNTHSAIVASVSFQKPASGTFRYLKVSRVKPKGVSVIAIAAVLARDNGRIGNARVVFGNMAPEPRRARAVESVLGGSSLDESSIERCIASCTDGMDPKDDALASAWYRSTIAPVYLKRLLLQRSDY